MTPTPIIPSPDALPLPAPAPLLHALLLLTFALHLLAMNALVGGAVLALWLRLRGAAAGPAAPGAAALIGKALPVCVAATVTFGVAPLLFLQALYGRFFFTSSVIMAWPWFWVIPLLTVAYYGTYLESFRGARLGALRTPLLAATTAIFAAIALIYVSNATLMLRPETWPALHFGDPGGANGNFGDPQVVPRWLHMLLGAVALGGLMLALWGQARRSRDPEGGLLMRRLGLGALGWLTMANFAVGLWFLIALDREVMLQFMGGSGHATGLLGTGVVLALALIALAMRARSHDDARLAPLVIVAAVTLVVMVLMRDFVRAAYLARHGEPVAVPVATQGLNLALFAALLAAAVATVWWMARRLARGAG